MRFSFFLGIGLLSVLGAQETNPTQRSAGAQTASGDAPLYRVNVVERTTKAVNYGHRSLPTPIDFRGTIFSPESKGEATIKSSRGVVEVDAKFKNLPAPQRFGREYLTYVLWAVTPQGRASNLGELLTNSSDKAKIETASELQTFALIVTAEPYYAVTQPSNVVVLENEVRPDTVGSVQTVDAKYELLPRGETTLDLEAARQRENQPAAKVSQKEYEALVELYQARSAVQWAQHEGADRWAPDTLAKAQERLRQAESQYDRTPKSEKVVTLAREATQTAEDARLISLRKKQAGPVESATSR